MYDIEKIHQATSVEDAIKHLVADPNCYNYCRWK